VVLDHPHDGQENAIGGTGQAISIPLALQQGALPAFCDFRTPAEDFKVDVAF
jgi:hypothetical protein